MKFILMIILSFVSSACAQINSQPKSVTIRPGEVRFIEFSLQTDDAKFFCKDVETKFVKSNNVGYAFVIETYFSDLKPFSCKVMSQNKVQAEIRFTVENKEYMAEQLKVDQKRIQLSPKNEKRVMKEQVVLDRIYASSESQFLFDQAFMQPMDSYVTSVYGIKRVYNKEKKGQHLGIDYRAAIGDKVPAANGGKIVFSGDLFYTGWTVIIDHGLDIFTVYGHLSKTLVNSGEMVKRGQLIGLSGNTGRTSGPHLHWGVKIQGQYIDGLVLIEESKKNFHN